MGISKSSIARPSATFVTLEIRNFERLKLQVMFAQMGVKTFYIGVSKDDPGRATVMFQGPENVLFDIFMNPETKPVVEASGHIYDGTVITRWLA